MGARYPIRMLAAGAVPRPLAVGLRMRRVPELVPAPLAAPSLSWDGTGIIRLRGSGVLRLPIGMNILVTMIGAGSGGMTAAPSPFGGGCGGGSGMYIRKKPLVVEGPIDYSIPESVGSSTSTGDPTIFGALIAASATLEFGVGFGWIGIGGGNTYGDASPGFQIDDWTWAGANGGRGGGYPGGSYPASGAASAGGISPIADDDAITPPIAGGLAGTWLGAPADDVPGGGGAASPMGSGGNGGNLLPVEDGDDALSWGAGGGGGAGENGGSYADGGASGAGTIVVELGVPPPV